MKTGELVENYRNIFVGNCGNGMHVVLRRHHARNVVFICLYFVSKRNYFAQKHIHFVARGCAVAPDGNSVAFASQSFYIRNIGFKLQQVAFKPFELGGNVAVIEKPSRFNVFS